MIPISRYDCVPTKVQSKYVRTYVRTYVTYIRTIRAAESESEPESESVGVRCFARSRSRSRSRQNLPTPTDSGKRLIGDSKKSPCRLVKAFSVQIYVMDWLDDRYRTGARISASPDTHPAPYFWNVALGLNRVLTFFAIALDQLTKLFEHSPIPISMAPPWRIGRSNNVVHWSNAIAKRVQLCYGGSSHPIGWRVNACPDPLHLIVCVNDALDVWETNMHVTELPPACSFWPAIKCLAKECLHMNSTMRLFKTGRSRSWSRSRHENTDSGVGVDSDENPIDSAALRTMSMSMQCDSTCHWTFVLV